MPFTDSDFLEIAKIAESQFGLSLAESKKPLVYSRLSKRLKNKNINNFPEYLKLLKGDSEPLELMELVSALTTNVTSFFREKHHFETLHEEMTSRSSEILDTNGRIRIWSAGCSTGEEAYSIAMTLLDTIPNITKKNIRVLATDIDPKVVNTARTATYPSESFSGLPKHYKKFTSQTESGDTKIDQQVTALITFAELNLMNDWPFSGPFDAIFCRNVAIYFSQETQQRLWNRFCDMLTENGLLFIGHSERVTGPASQRLQGTGITTYRKITKRNQAI